MKKENRNIRNGSTGKGRPIVLALSAVGIVLSAYLTYLHYTQADAAFCAAGSGCDAVRESSYSAILGVPVSLFGVIGYSLIFALSLVSISSRTKWLLLYVVSLAGLAFSAYLTYLEFFVINATCTFCLISAVIITAIFVVTFLGTTKLSPGFPLARLATVSAVVIAGVVLGSAFLQSGKLSADSGSDNTIQTRLAKHLARIDATMYGSYLCPHCLSQKKLFGDAFRYVKYVECHPKGDDANPYLCYTKGIASYPTWEINGRFYVGAKSLQELARLSGYGGQNTKQGN